MFIVWDISGATPNRLGEHGFVLQPVVAALKDNYIVTNSRNGLVVFNVANPSQPQLVKHLPLRSFQAEVSTGRLIFAGDVGIYSAPLPSSTLPTQQARNFSSLTPTNNSSFTPSQSSVTTFMSGMLVVWTFTA
jgi:hypothetical protein